MTDDIPTDADAPADDNLPGGRGVAHLGLARPQGDAPARDGWTGERTPPFDLLAEQSALGGMMLAASVIDDVIEHAAPGDFYLPKHEEIARAIVTLHRAGKPTDVIAVTDELTRTGRLSRAGGAEYLHTCTGVVPTAANAGYYASIVASMAVMRGLIEAGTRIVQMGYASEGDPADLVENARAEVDSLATRKKIPILKVGETIHHLVENLEAPPTYLRTPWEALDSLIGGFTPGGLFIIAARPGAGKSIALLQCANRLAHDGMVAFSSLEMTVPELQQRLLAQIGSVGMTSLRDHTLSEYDWNSLAYARSRVMDIPLFIDDTPDASMTHIRSFVRSVGREGALSAAVIDYLQIVKADGPNRELAVSNTALEMKHLAKEHGIAVIAAAQLRRASTFRGRARTAPSMDDLRESGGIENHADAILLIDRTADDIKRGEATITVAKTRNGRVGEFQVRWEPQFSRMQSLGWSPTPGLFE